MIGTTQKVLSNLQKMSSDKKSQLAARHEEHSVWLATELAKIKNLLKRPGDDDAAQSSSKADESCRGKRKSPDITENPHIRQSPEQKRSSTDYTQLALDAGLPADLNKLKKEQLLNEIESRGDTSFTIKSLKKELVDALKDLLVMESMKMTEADGEVDTEAESSTGTGTGSNDTEASNGFSTSTGDATDDCSGNDKEPAAASIADESSTASCASPAPAASSVSHDPKQALQERMARHRLSQARKSNVPAPAADGSDDTPPGTSTDSDSCEDGGSSPAADPNTAATEANTAANEGQSDTVTPAVGDAEASSEAMTAVDEDNTGADRPSSAWQDVHSPLVAPSSQSAIGTAAAAAAAAAASAATTTASAAEQAPAPATGTATTSAPSVAATKQPGAGSKNVLASFSVQSKSTAAAGNKPTTANGATSSGGSSTLLKKPGNIVSQSSFLDKGKPAAQPIAALAQAAKLREAEELKALQKKQALLQAQQQQAQSGSITSASIIMKANMTLNSTANANANAAGAAGKSTAHGGAGAGGFNSAASAKARLPPQMVPSAPVAKPTAAATASAPTAPAAGSEAGVSSIMGFLNPFSKATTPTPTRSDSGAATDAATATAQAAVASNLPSKPAVPPSAQSPAKQVLQPHQPQAAKVQAMMQAQQQLQQQQQQQQQQQLQQQQADEEEEEEQQYEMDDMADSDEDDSGTDEESDNKEKFIPEWARSVNLKAALARQFGMVQGVPPMDPDLIFPEVATCSLEEIFGKMEGKFGKYARRTSSAKWEHDELTLVEKRKYRNAMGYSVPDAHQL